MKKDQELASIGDEPNQPNSSFPFKKRVIGGTNRNFQHKWFSEFPWLHYNEKEDKVFCFYCIKCIKFGLKSDKNFSRSVNFTHQGFNYWNKAVERFRIHQESEEHDWAKWKIVDAPKSTQIHEILDSQTSKQMAINRKCFMKLLQNLQFLALSNIAIQGHEKEKSNFFGLAKLRANDDEDLVNWIQKKRYNYMHHNVQNELLELMAKEVLNKNIMKHIQEAQFFTVMCDETTDVSNQEQAVICIRSVNDKFENREDFIELRQLESTTAESIFTMLNEVLHDFDLPVSKLRGQCYDGAANMSGKVNGVVKKFQEIENRAIYIHCFGHLVNLATGDCIRNNRILQDALDNAFEIIKLIKKSPKREAIFKRMKKEFGDTSTGIRSLCPTRWTVKANSILSIIENYLLLIKTFKEDLEQTKSMPFEMKTRINGQIGDNGYMFKFSSFFGFKLAHFILRHTDLLAKKLQSPNLNAAEGYEMAMMTVLILEEENKTERFENFFNSVVETARDIGVNDPLLPRKRKVPAKLVDSLEPIPVHSSISEMYQGFYSSALETMITNIKNRFQHRGYEMVTNLENLLLKSASGEDSLEELEKVSAFYGSDIDKGLLEAQLLVFKSKFKELKQEKVVLKDIMNFMRKPGHSEILSEISTVLKLILVLPATDAESERVFSSLKRIKTYLRNSMSQARLNHLMLMNIHKEETDQMSLAEVANKFAAKLPKRREDFGINKFM